MSIKNHKNIYFSWYMLIKTTVLSQHTKQICVYHWHKTQLIKQSLLKCKFYQCESYLSKLLATVWWSFTAFNAFILSLKLEFSHQHSKRKQNFVYMTKNCDFLISHITWRLTLKFWLLLNRSIVNIKKKKNFLPKSWQWNNSELTINTFNC